MDVSNWSDESVLEEEDKVDGQGNASKPKIGVLGGCLIAIGGFFLLLLTICGGSVLINSFQKYPTIDVMNVPAYIEPGQSVQLEVSFTDMKKTDVNWEVDAPEIASISPSGELKGIKPGRVMIQLQTMNGDVQNEYQTMVLKPATKVTVKNQQVTLRKGETVDLGIQVTPADASVYIYSSEQMIATTSGSKLFGVAPGKAEVYIVKGLDLDNAVIDQPYAKISVVVTP
jgi:uncharacterized protein YjdB